MKIDMEHDNGTDSSILVASDLWGGLILKADDDQIAVCQRDGKIIVRKIDQNENGPWLCTCSQEKSKLGFRLNDET